MSFLVFVDAFWLGEILMWDNRASMIFFFYLLGCAFELDRSQIGSLVLN